MAFVPIGPGAYAATTTLTDQPIAAKVAAKPNIIFTLDDSGSMSLNYSPDFVWAQSRVNYAARLLPQHQRPDERGLRQSPRALRVQSRLRRADVRVGVQPDVLQPEHHLRRRRWTATATRPRPHSPTAPAAPTSSPACATVYKSMNAANTTNWTRVPNDMYLLAPASLAAAADHQHDQPRGDGRHAGVLQHRLAARRSTTAVDRDWRMSATVNGEYYEHGGHGLPDQRHPVRSRR